MFAKDVFLWICCYIRKIELTDCKTVQKRYKESYRFSIILEHSQKLIYGAEFRGSAWRLFPKLISKTFHDLKLCLRVGCVRYFFARLFCKHKGKSLWSKEKGFFYFTLKTFFILEIIKFKACVGYFFIKFFFFLPNDSPSKTMKNVSSKKLFSFSRCSSLCGFFPSFSHFSDSKGQMEVE